jgi:hypothetical protein
LIPRYLIPLALGAICWTQLAAAPSRLTIKIIAGEGAVNNVPMRVAAQPAVEVLDENNAPVAGAEVIFHIPSNGPGGSFFGGIQTNTLVTDAKGQARASGFIPNDRIGKFAIMIRASVGSVVAEGVINQTNGGGPGGSAGTKMSSNQKKIWILVAAGAAAAIGGGVAASGGNSSSTAATAAKRPVSIGAGPITVGGPR